EKLVLAHQQDFTRREGVPGTRPHESPRWPAALEQAKRGAPLQVGEEYGVTIEPCLVHAWSKHGNDDSCAGDAERPWSPPAAREHCRGGLDRTGREVQDRRDDRQQVARLVVADAEDDETAEHGEAGD